MPRSLIIKQYERYLIHQKKGMSIDELVRKKQGLTHNAKQVLFEFIKTGEYLIIHGNVLEKQK